MVRYTVWTKPINDEICPFDSLLRLSGLEMRLRLTQPKLLIAQCPLWFLKSSLRTMAAGRLRRNAEGQNKAGANGMVGRELWTVNAPPDPLIKECQ